MPKSSFFDAVTLPQGAVPGGTPQRRPLPGAGAPPLGAYYNNIYGTGANVNWNPSTNRVSADLHAPIGDHQNQLFLNAAGYYQPSGSAGASDYGFRLGFEKKIEPRGETGGRLLDRVLSRDPSIQALGVQEGAVLPANVRTGILSSLPPEKLKELSDQVREAQRIAKDEQLGIRPGAPKYSGGIFVGSPGDASRGSSGSQEEDYVPAGDPQKRALQQLGQYVQRLGATQ